MSNSSSLQLLLIDKKVQEVNSLLNQAGHLIESWNGNCHQKEYLRVYFLVLQVLVFIIIVCDRSNLLDD